MSFQARLMQDCQRLPNGNLEFSWKDREYNGMNILEKVRHEGDSSCVFQAMCSGTEMAIRKAAADQNPPSTSDIEFNASSLVEDYENYYERKLDDEPAMDLPKDARETGAIHIFSTTGVLATSTGWAGQRRVKLASCRIQRKPLFDQVANLIRNGRPVLGSFSTDEEFLQLEPHQIYEFSGRDKDTNFSHMVLFVGYGYEASTGSRYLIFVNSYGEDWADEGFGRVYFKEVFRDRLYVLSADAPKPNASTSPVPKRKPIQDPDDHCASPVQRLRLDGDD